MSPVLFDGGDVVVVVGGVAASVVDDVTPIVAGTADIRVVADEADNVVPAAIVVV